MRCRGAVQAGCGYLCGYSRNGKQLTTKMASEALADVFENERMTEREVVRAENRLEIPLHVEFNIVCGMAVEVGA